MSEGQNLWGAIGELHRTRGDLIRQLADVLHDGADSACSFCGQAPPEVTVIRGAEASICDRCVDLCREILALSDAG